MSNVNKPCIAFSMKNAEEAMKHIDKEAVRRYGWECNGHLLHAWDDEERVLFRCRNCGGYILVQLSELHGMEYDEYYADYFPVSGPEEAEEPNQKYDGFEIEDKSGKPYIGQPARVAGRLQSPEAQGSASFMIRWKTPALYSLRTTWNPLNV